MLEARARLEGFSLHANVALPAHAREPLEHLCRSLLRPPLALERLTESSGRQLLYELPHAPRDGSTHLLLDPPELTEKLSVLIPRFHLLRSHGVLAPAPNVAPQWSPGRPGPSRSAEDLRHPLRLRSLRGLLRPGPDASPGRP